MKLVDVAMRPLIRRETHRLLAMLVDTEVKCGNERGFFDYVFTCSGVHLTHGALTNVVVYASFLRSKGAPPPGAFTYHIFWMHRLSTRCLSAILWFFL